MRIVVAALCVVAPLAIFLGIREAYHTGFRAGFKENAFRVSYAGRRANVVLEQSRKIAPDGVLVLGDSIVEMQSLTTLCGRPAFNAGISTIRAGQLASRSAAIAAAARPSLAIVAVGINDARRDVLTPDATWRSDYRRLLKTLSGVPVVIVSIEPVEANRVEHGLFDLARVDAQNLALREIAKELGVRLVPPLSSVAGLTLDGVHLNREGDLQWRGAIELACRAR